MLCKKCVGGGVVGRPLYNNISSGRSRTKSNWNWNSVFTLMRWEGVDQCPTREEEEEGIVIRWLRNKWAIERLSQVEEGILLISFITPT